MSTISWPKHIVITYAAHVLTISCLQLSRFARVHGPGLEFVLIWTSHRLTPYVLWAFCSSSSRTLSSFGQPPAGSSGLCRASFFAFFARRAEASASKAKERPRSDILCSVGLSECCACTVVTV